jgi:hypothetical protein
MGTDAGRAGASPIVEAAGANVSEDELSDVEGDGDGSSSLSDIEDKDDEPENGPDGSDEELSNVYDEENDSEAETERLEESPNQIRTHKDVVVSAHNDAQIYSHSPSKLHNQIMADVQDEDDDDDPLSDEISLRESPKSSLHEDLEPPTAATSLESFMDEGKQIIPNIESGGRKRKRSIMAGSGLVGDDDGPLRKRTGSILAPGDDYAVEDEEHPDEEADTSNPISGNISGDEEREEQEDEVAHEAEEPVAAEEALEAVETQASPKRRGRKKKKGAENCVNHEEDGIVTLESDMALNGEDESPNGDEEGADNEGYDEVEAALKNEEERTYFVSLLSMRHLTKVSSREEASCPGAAGCHREALRNFQRQVRIYTTAVIHFTETIADSTMNGLSN